MPIYTIPVQHSISVVVPVYGCVGCLPELYQRLCTALGSITNSYQLIFVNDQSPDDSWAVVEALAAADSHVLGVDLSRNFGQHAALTAGLDRATGEWVVVMDCDLQDQPEEILRLYAHAQQEHLDVVFARRVIRQDTASKRWGSQLFHGLLKWLGGPVHDPAASNFGIFHCQVVAALRLLREPTRAFPLHVRWLGFRQGALEVTHAARQHGRSGYRLGQLLRLATNALLAHSDKPLRLLVKLGVGTLAGALLAVAYLAGRAVLGLNHRSLMMAAILVSVWLLSGLGLAALGLVGLYVGKTFEGVKGRPLYIVRTETPGAAERRH